MSRAKESNRFLSPYNTKKPTLSDLKKYTFKIKLLIFLFVEMTKIATNIQKLNNQ
ncbi:hypothetical protein AsAng_0062270 [Aureispira anguillae]|uniref:Uncharacterized protein n=1 Tax=Aureispira anguillae TaxID=2864201 RepID=A0A915YLR4_9BACT|nr:hypothetical protein AsAng_0062270 [Aureispira anguillae]